MTKEYKLYKGTVNLLKELLSIGGWNNEIVDTYNAGKLIETLPDNKLDTPETRMEIVTVTLNDRQVNTVTKALKHHVSKGIVLPSPFAVQAIEEFELVSKED